MHKQRTLFWGKIPDRSPKKDGENQPVPDRRFTAVSVQDVEIRFSNTTVTQFGGYPLWSSFVDSVGLNVKFALIGGLGAMVNQPLYRQSVNLPKDFEAFHADTLAKLPKGVSICLSQNISVRELTSAADGG